MKEKLQIWKVFVFQICFNRTRIFDCGIFVIHVD